jgi:spore coat protein U-like protein
MNIKKILTLGTLALAVSASSTVFALNSASSSATVSLTLAGSCTIDASAASGAFDAVAVSGVSATATRTTSVSVNCTNTMPFKLGVDHGANYAPGVGRGLTDGAHADILYVVKQGGTAIGDADISVYDPTYASTPLTAENAYVSAGTGAAQAVPIVFEATIPADQPGGVYSDTVNFVVAWP